MTPPLCPVNPDHGPTMHVVITQGDKMLGCAWLCVRDDESKADYCSGVLDCDCVDAQREPEQLSMFGEM